MVYKIFRMCGLFVAFVVSFGIIIIFARTLKGILIGLSWIIFIIYFGLFIYYCGEVGESLNFIIWIFASLICAVLVTVAAFILGA